MTLFRAGDRTQRHKLKSKSHLAQPAADRRWKRSVKKITAAAQEGAVLLYFGGWAVSIKLEKSLERTEACFGF